jgi:OPA family glycerol-3-phosphate transporter-like MFS transporter
MLLTTGALSILAFANFGGSQLVPVALVAVVAFAMIGPYSYLAGAISLDFGGKQGSATTSGLIDGVGYLGGVLAGNSMAGISVAWGWRGAFAVLAAVALISSVTAGIYLSRLRSQS